MSQGILSLPQEVVHLMAAGEVIDSLAAVVRELCENALDASATRISIAVWVDQWRVRVSDNGIGMSLADLQRAAAAHSTSKIRDRQDLQQIKSLGFRGEALYSVAQLANLQIASRSAQPQADERIAPADAETPLAAGWLVTYNAQGAVAQLEPIAIAPGTIVTIDDIFASLPGRRQGLPTPAQQLRAIQLVVQHLALSHPHVTWQVQQGDREWFTLFPGDSPRHILPQILRDVQVGDLAEVGQARVGQAKEAGKEDEADEENENTHLEFFSHLPNHAPALYLLLGLPDRCHRHRPDWIKICVNGRFVQLPELEQTVLAEFRRTVPRDRYPVCLVYLQVQPEEIDWNRHPAKTEIYLHHLDRWQTAIRQAIAQGLLQSHYAPESYHSARIGNLLKTAEMGGHYRTEPESTASGAVQSPPLEGLKALAQVHNTYILVEHRTGIWLIEQHIAHERVLYEELRDRWQLVPLASPLILNHLTVAQQEQLQRIGIDLEPFGEETWMVRHVPIMLVDRADCGEALVELSLGGDLPAAQAAIACRSAIKNGTALTPAEMQTLVDQWQQTANSHTCPHGRPICLRLEESSLARFFRRHWMIGKSHGI